jgi:hypothetical protein
VPTLPAEEMPEVLPADEDSIITRFAHRNMRVVNVVNVIVGVGAGVLITPVAAFLAVLSGGAGHGHYELARLFFPYTMLLTRLAGDTITLPLILLALAQFPVYGAVLGIARSRSRVVAAGGLLLAGHTIAVVLCFSGLIPNFS